MTKYWHSLTEEEFHDSLWADNKEEAAKRVVVKLGLVEGGYFYLGVDGGTGAELLRKATTSCVDDIIHEIGNGMLCFVGEEFVQGWPDQSEDDERKLTDVIVNWASECNLLPRFSHIDDITRVVVTQAMLEEQTPPVTKQ